MGLFRDLAQWLRPCVHTWRIVSKMEDDPKDPRQVTIIRECEICGELDEQKFSGPQRRCPPHKWEQTGKSAVWAKEGDKFPAYDRIYQRCELCGEQRAIDMLPEGHWKLKANKQQPTKKEEAK